MTTETPTNDQIRTVAVIGLGTMGAGIVEVFARAGLTVRGIEYNDQALERGRAILQKSTDRAVAKEKLTADEQAALLGRIEFTTDTAAGVTDADLVIEAVNENLELKTSIFQTIDEAAPKTAILASNTSSLSVTAIAAAVADPSRVLGVHFFNPAPVQTLVELIRTVHTSDQTIQRMADLLRGLGKSPIVCGDRAGFIVNALLVPYLGSAIRLYENGFCTREELDQAMVEQAGYPMGPLTLTDLVGNDVTLAVLERMYDETKDRLTAPPSLLRQLVTAGWHGRKSGRGFYSYAAEGADDPGPVPPPRGSRAGELPDRLVAEYLNNCLRMVEVGYASVDDIDTGMVEGCRMPPPFEVLATLGPKHVLDVQRRTFDETAEPGHRPALLLEQLAQVENPAAAIDELRRATAA
ncbi:3-hydroxyacyl-CoA dehydrogenase [Enemella evansiae]|uniref:3-hydroxyacyl-CoA dehydrogenase n=1 Tax=Enemella evansiae TaxID=2016499 RepID=UPI0010E8D45A|nr:3-hydroxybutyryl-CoA dehydrogenase [Enemella evansiae]TDO93380.1 3-hydroxybutyryl-CoA dehydrogenase [Enemella evansiae]